MTAAFTIARNEPFFLPLWLAYYGGQVGLENLFVLDHETDDGSTDDLPCERVPVDNAGVCFDHEWLCATAATFQADLLARGFGPVIYGDVDEFLCHPLGLRGFLQSVQAGACRATGYNLIHGPAEADYDAAQPLLAQRGWWKHSSLYDKTLVAREPLQWEVGFHFLQGRSFAVRADGLTLVHLHSFDRTQARQRHAARAGWPWHEGERRLGHSKQWQLEGAALEGWLEEQTVGAEPVAGWLKEQVPF